MATIDTYLRRHQHWSLQTFGPGRRTVGLTKHIEKECQEIRDEADPDSEAALLEWIDIIILALDGYWRAGGEPHLLMTRLIRKQDINIAREWGPPVPEDQPSEHVRRAEA